MRPAWPSSTSSRRRRRPARRAAIAARSGGFLYCVSLVGVTGARTVAAVDGRAAGPRRQGRLAGPGRGRVRGQPPGPRPGDRAGRRRRRHRRLGARRRARPGRSRHRRPGAPRRGAACGHLSRWGIMATWRRSTSERRTGTRRSGSLARARRPTRSAPTSRSRRPTASSISVPGPGSSAWRCSTTSASSSSPSRRTGCWRSSPRSWRPPTCRRSRAVKLDLVADPPPAEPFDLAVSFLVLHHIEDTAAALAGDPPHAACRAAGWRCRISTPRTAPSTAPRPRGSTTSGSTGTSSSELARAAGFVDVEARSAIDIEDEGRHYPAFLLLGRNP